MDELKLTAESYSVGFSSGPTVIVKVNGLKIGKLVVNADHVNRIVAYLNAYPHGTTGCEAESPKGWSPHGL